LAGNIEMGGFQSDLHFFALKSIGLKQVIKPSLDEKCKESPNPKLPTSLLLDAA
jgi:hypothetical protein